MSGSYPADVVLIAGAPCSGKSTLAAGLAGRGDLVLDFDDIAKCLGSPAGWLHPEPFRSRAEMEIRSHLARLPGMGSGTAYVIRSAASAKARAIAAKSIGAGLCVVLDVSEGECHRRADSESRPSGTHEQISKWFADFSPWSGDTFHGGESWI